MLQQSRFDGVLTELLKEERRLGEIEDRLRRLEEERVAGDVHQIARALSVTREALSEQARAAA